MLENWGTLAMTAFRIEWQQLRHNMASALFAPTCMLLLSACAIEQNAPIAETAPAPTIGTDREAMQARMDRLERDLANLRIDYSIVRPSMERLVSKETGLEQRLTNIEAAFGPMTASITKANKKTSHASTQATNIKTAYTKMAPPKSDEKQPLSATIGNYGVHLASYKALENIEKGWVTLQKDHTALLANLEPYVRTFTNSSKGGTYKRLIAGPIASTAEADALCKKLKQSGVWCQAVSLDGRPN